jgi:hypothetical protein
MPGSAHLSGVRPKREYCAERPASLRLCSAVRRDSLFLTNDLFSRLRVQADSALYERFTGIFSNSHRKPANVFFSQTQPGELLQCRTNDHLLQGVAWNSAAAYERTDAMSEFNQAVVFQPLFVTQSNQGIYLRGTMRR